jgi:hypothetical protein
MLELEKFAPGRTMYTRTEEQWGSKSCGTIC